MAQSDRKSKPNLDAAEFDARLAKAGLTKTRFAELTGVRRNSVSRWNRIGAPAWTVPFLMLYSRGSGAVKRLIDDWADFSGEP